MPHSVPALVALVSFVLGVLNIVRAMALTQPLAPWIDQHAVLQSALGISHYVAGLALMASACLDRRVSLVVLTCIPAVYISEALILSGAALPIVSLVLSALTAAFGWWHITRDHEMRI